MELQALFVKAPVAPYPAIAVTVPVTCTNTSSQNFVDFLRAQGIAFDDETYTGFIPATAMESFFDTLRTAAEQDPDFMPGGLYMITALLEEVDTFEEPLDCYITAC